MDKLLLMSILSFGNSATFWIEPPSKWRSLDVKKQEIRKEDRKENCCSGEEKRPAAKTPGRKSGSSPSVAPEFDGLNIFETFVFH
ncbi:hypothetical protein M5K25_027128 [Dendrobium thyrsiflorum]|uniref:Uncharacterized protein n=1 Tax=Dendrobium thyrsiflorum TaxID=117978 RepID=A0ABD0TZK4_DENTH